MLKNRLVKRTGDVADGSVVFAPTRPLRFLGFPIVHITGWQERKEGGAMPPFLRGPGTAPPNFIEVTVRGTAAELRGAAAAAGLGRYRPADAVFQIKNGDTDIAVRKPVRGVATITCMAGRE